MTPRPARPDETAAITALVQRAYAPWAMLLGRRPAPMDDDYAAHIAAGEVWVLTDGADIVALSVLVDAPDHLLIDNVAVHPSHQRQGLGRHLIAHAEALARERGRGELRLFTNAQMARNITLYRRLGFVETHRATVGEYRRVFMTMPLGDTSA